MKPVHVFLIFFIVLLIIIVGARSCQDEGTYDIPNVDNGDSISSEHDNSFSQSDNNINHSFIESEWPDSIFESVSSASYLSHLDKDVIIELNKCRTNPTLYAELYLKPLLSNMKDNGTYVNSEGLNIKSDEGKAAIVEAITALQSQNPLSILHPQKYLCQAASDHCNDQGSQSLVGHGGSDGSSPSSRVKRYNPQCRGIGENIDYGSHSAQEIVCSLIVDDGVPDRGHRKNIFNSSYLNVGVAYGSHSGYRQMCVIDFETR